MAGMGCVIERLGRMPATLTLNAAAARHSIESKMSLIRYEVQYRSSGGIIGMEGAMDIFRSELRRRSLLKTLPAIPAALVVRVRIGSAARKKTVRIVQFDASGARLSISELVRIEKPIAEWKR